MMLSRTSLPVRRVASAYRVTAARAKSTTADSASKPQEATPKPERKARIPLAESFADLLIPSENVSQNKSQFSVGLSSLGQDQFAGRGTLINRLQRMRRKTADQDGPKGEQKQQQQRQPRRQQRENASAATRSAVQDPKERINKRDNKKDGNAVIRSQKRGEGARGVKVAKAQDQDQDAPKSEYSTIEIGQLPEQELVRKTDLSSLFSAPSPTTHQVVPLNTTTIVRTSTKSSRGQIILERMNGDYSRYLPSNLGATPKETMQTAGPVGYATLALSRVPAVTLRQRQNALAIVSRLAGPITPSRTAKAS